MIERRRPVDKTTERPRSKGLKNELVEADDKFERD